MKAPAALFSSLIAAACFAQAPDVAALYDVTTDGSSQTVKAGEKGKLVIEFHTKAGSHISGDAPLKIELSGKAAKLEKEKLTGADSISKKVEGKEYVDPKFEVPFTVATAGKTSVEAKLTFFICTDKVCARQQKTLTVPVEVN
jgi:hypothetical protein